MNPETLPIEAYPLYPGATQTSGKPFLTAAHQPVLKVLGLGGGGSNAVNRMIELGLTGVEFITANTDRQALMQSLAPTKIQLGPKITRGLGAGGTPAIGQTAAEESYREIAAALKGADMVFLTAGMGGGTGTGSIAVAAKISRYLGAVTIGIVTTPFSFERGVRQRNASEGLARLRPNTDTLIAIPNDRLLYIAPRNLPLEVAFHLADDVLRQAVQGITELITETGVINVDFAHVQHIMKLGGGALMAIGHGQGENKALQAVEQALHHPLLETACLDNAAGMLVNFTANEDLSLFEIETALTHLQHQTGVQTEIVMGVNHDERLQDRAQVILIITGLGAPTLEDTLAQQKKAPAGKPSRAAHSYSPRGESALSAGFDAGVSMTPLPGEAQPYSMLEADQAAAYPPLAQRESRDGVNIVAHNLDIPAFLRRR